MAVLESRFSSMTRLHLPDYLSAPTRFSPMQAHMAKGMSDDSSRKRGENSLSLSGLAAMVLNRMRGCGILLPCSLIK